MSADPRRRIDLALPWRRPGRAAPAEGNVDELSVEDRAIAERALPFTMTGVLRLQALIDAVRYCVQRDLRGAFAECGVWRGGSVLTMILTLQSLGRTDRDIYLYDTFEGMTQPTEHDVSSFDGAALDAWNTAQERNQRAWSELFDPESFDEAAVRKMAGEKLTASQILEITTPKAAEPSAVLNA